MLAVHESLQFNHLHHMRVKSCHIYLFHSAEDYYSNLQTKISNQYLILLFPIYLVRVKYWSINGFTCLYTPIRRGLLHVPYVGLDMKRKCFQLLRVVLKALPLLLVYLLSKKWTFEQLIGYSFHFHKGPKVQYTCKSSVADPGRYWTDPDPDPAVVKKRIRIRILVKYDYIAHM